MSDASRIIHGYIFYLISGITINGTYHAKYTILSAKNFINKSTILSIPYFELFSCLKMVKALPQTLDWLKGMGISIDPKNVYLATDSSTALIQLRSPANKFSSRVNHCIAAIHLVLDQLSLNSFENFYFFQQKMATFPVDSITKCPENRNKLQEWVNKLYPDWLKHDPKTWDFLQRGKFLPNLLEKQFIENLEFSPNWIPFQSTVLDKANLLGLFDPLENPSQQAHHVPHMAFTTKVDNAPSIVCLQTYPSRIFNHTFSNLYERKLSFGIRGPNSATQILARCYFWFQRFRYVANLKGDQKIHAKNKLLDHFKTLTENTTPWCGKVLCTRTKPLCTSPHHISVPKDKSCKATFNLDGTVQLHCTLKRTDLIAPECTDFICKGGVFHQDHSHVIWNPLIHKDGDLSQVVRNEQDPKGVMFNYAQFHELNQTPLDLHYNFLRLANYLVHWPYDSEHNYILSECILNIMSGHFSEHKDHRSLKFQCYTLNLFPECSIKYAYGRLQRHATNVDKLKGRPLFRIIDPTSILGKALLTSAHLEGTAHHLYQSGPSKRKCIYITKWILFAQP